ncbi:MAG TPA: LptF/LptG family permease [Candidatus Marinimicrobia bacterium]|jgi:lipopolysaccharide export system permease protein|nr:LptF/LptG family permease [Candidatus Neomarinimicrobiota bacterium]MDP7437644.1 LptF/LptG family permease [Candidatus Neomarinimicrobiota bacterium]HJM70379.1 LptF/LptG family permease [Candidatus Neomarinimicrobiota bacterium]|tara:strand:- start:2413 stop:3789 length:1377 start_codon:yes stop_codon:yes gene_type:complete
MRLLPRYIARELVLPFIFALGIIVFILFINFFLRAVDRFLGKGLDLFTILEYLFLNLAWIVALAVPMAVLIATLMSFGRLSEDNEINALRSSGISFLTILRPALVFGAAVCLLLIIFNTRILPEMNFNARLLAGDIRKMRPGLDIEPGHFIDNIPDYSMIIRGKNGNLMEDVRIFSKESKDVQTSIYSETGELSTLDDAIIMTLYDGEIHELDLDNYNNYRRINFEKHVITIPADDLMINRRDTANRSDREMTVALMQEKKVKFAERKQRVEERLQETIKKVTDLDILPENFADAQKLLNRYNEEIKQDTAMTAAQMRLKERRLRSLERQAKNEFRLLDSYTRSWNKYAVEIHKKFSLPVACILFVLVGAPLGTLSQRGGFAVAITLGFGFFLIYYIFLIGGEEMADRNIVSPIIGMWTPNVILAFLGGYLTLHSVRERAPIDFKWTWQKTEEENESE